MQFFFNDEALNELAFKVYNNSKNYKIIEKNGADTIYIFFSSHGLYYPNTYAEFYKKVVEKDYFEWENLSKSIKNAQASAEMLFIRDIYKNWCLNGISSKHPSAEKVFELLKTFSKKNIITVGSSAGGYMAILFGCLLKAKKIFCFSPQVNLHIYNKFHPYKKYEEYIKDSEKSKCLDLLPFIKEYKGELFYFYPNKSQEDIEQYRAIGSIENIKVFPINRKLHGATVFPQNMVDLLSMNDQELQILSGFNHAKSINLFWFSVKVSGFLGTAKICLHKTLKRIKTLLH